MCKIPKWTIICLYLLTFTSLCASASSTGERNGRYKRTLLDLFPSLKTKRLTKDMISLLNERHSRPKRANPDFENLLYSLYLPRDDRGRSKRKFRKYNLFTLSGLHESDVLENELSVDSSTTPIPIEAIMQMNVPELQNYIFDGDNVKYKEHYLGDDVLLKQMTPQNIAIRAGSSTANLTTTTELEDACTDLVTEALQTTSTAPTTVTKTTPVLVTEPSHLSSNSSTLITDVQTSADLTLTTNTTRDLSTEVINISSASTSTTDTTRVSTTERSQTTSSAPISVADTTRPSTTESSQTISSTLTSVTDTTPVSTTESSQTTTATHTSVTDTIRPSTTESSQTTSSTLTSVTDTTQVTTTESSQTTTATHTSVTDTIQASTTKSSQTTSTTPTSTTDTTPVSTTESSQMTTATHTSVTDTIRPSTTESSQTTTATHTSTTDTTPVSTTESSQTTTATHTSVTDTTQASTTKSSQTTSTTPTSTTDTTRATTTESSQTTSTARASVIDNTQDVPSTNSVETNVQISTTIAVTYSTTKLTTSTDIVTPTTTSITSTESITSIETTNEIPTLNTAEYLNLLAKYGPDNQKTFGDDFFNTLPFIYYRTSYEGLEKGISLPSFGTLGYSSVGITEANNINNNECQKYKSFFAQKTYKRFVEEVARRVAEQMTAKRNSDTSVMEKILGEIEGIKNLASTNKDQKPGMFCDLNGSWTSASGGMRIDITKATDGSVQASLAERTPKKRLVEGFLGDASWKITATMPFKNSGLIILNAVHEEDRHAATFIGECKYCDNSEIVTGHWLLGRTSRDCKDQKAAHRLIGDVWRRENLNILRKQRLAELLTKPKRSG